MFMNQRTLLLASGLLGSLLAGTNALATTLVPLDETGDVLTPATTLVSSPTLSSLGPDFADANALDGKVRSVEADGDHGLLFSSNSDQNLSLSGFTPSAISDIRFYSITSDPARLPTSVAVRTSTSPVSTLTPTDYSNDVGTFALAFSGTPVVTSGTVDPNSKFATIAINAPAGTQSLFFSFTSTSGTRLQEVQAIPEPTSIAALSVGGLLLAQRRRR